MISIRIGQNGLDALRAYNPQRLYYSGQNGALALLGHCVVELVYQRAYEPRPVEVLANKRYDRIRNAQGRFVTVVKGTTVTKTEYRDRHQRSVVPVRPDWLGAKYRRMLVTRDFAMLNSYGAEVFGFRAPGPHAKNYEPDILVVWDCLWHDWRRIKLSSQPVSISAIIPTTIYPGLDYGIPQYKLPIDKEALRLIEIQKQVLFRIYEANFHGKRNALFQYMDNRMQFGLQFQEENLRKQYFQKYEDHQEELRKRRERDAERRRRQREEAERLKQQQAEQQQQQMQTEAEQKQSQEQQEMQQADAMANRQTNLEKPGDVEIRPDGTAKTEEDISDIGESETTTAPEPNKRKFK